MTTTCGAPGCSRAVRKHALCRRHRDRMARHGDPALGRKPPTLGTTEDRFWAQVDRRGDDDCWPWRGQTRRKGYGSLKERGRQVSAHRVSYELHHGPVPRGMHVMHSCDNPCCVNPHHLSAGTAAQNIADKCRKGRQARGSRVAGSRLSASAVREILQYPRHRGSGAELAARFAVTTGAISKIRRGSTWRHLSGLKP